MADEKPTDLTVMISNLAVLVAQLTRDMSNVVTATNSNVQRLNNIEAHLMSQQKSAQEKAKLDSQNSKVDPAPSSPASSNC